MEHEELAGALEPMLTEPIRAIERIGGGGNSRVYRIETDTRILAAKAYFQQTAGGRDRLAAEFECLEFLWGNGIRCVPRPIAVERKLQVALYEFISGKEIPAENVAEAHIDQLVSFLVDLKGLAASKEAGKLSPAAEASFTIAGIVENIRHRLNLLSTAREELEIYARLHDFLSGELLPALDRWQSEAERMLGTPEFFGEIPIGARTLSPSDFGFHNALLQGDGKLVFVDFEYFGWDDPTKMISDFHWHPRSTMPDYLKECFSRQLLTEFGNIAGFKNRLAAVYPLFGIKWCAILLNEFRPENLQRRRFAKEGLEETEKILEVQFEKAEKTLKRVNHGPRII